MERPLSLEYPVAVWHGMSRGNNRGDSSSHEDRLIFLALLREGVRRFRWILHEFVLMPKPSTSSVLPDAGENPSRGMKWVNQLAQWFNRRTIAWDTCSRDVSRASWSKCKRTARAAAIRRTQSPCGGMSERPEDIAESLPRKGGYDLPRLARAEWTLAQFGLTCGAQRESRRFVTRRHI